MEAIMALVITAGLVALIAVFCVIADKTIGWYYKHQDRKRRQAHPELYHLFDEVEEKGGECIRWYNTQIAPLKREVDALLRGRDYWTKAEAEKKEQQLEDLRQRIYLATITDNVLEQEQQEIREKIKKYVADNNLEWAKKWGW